MIIDPEYALIDTAVRFIDSETVSDPEAQSNQLWSIERSGTDLHIVNEQGASPVTVATFDASANSIDVTDITEGGSQVLVAGDNVDAVTLDGYDSLDFTRKAENASITGSWNVDEAAGGALSIGGSGVLTHADEGSIDAATLNGKSEQGVRPSASDSGTLVHGGPTDINFAGNLTVTDDTDGTITVDVADPNNTTDTRTNVSDDGTQIVSYVEDINFASHISVTDDADGTVTVDGTADTHITDGTTELNSIAGGSNVSISTSTGKATISATDTDSHTDVSANGTLVVADVGDINFSNNLSVTDDTDGTVTINASADGGDAATLDGYDSTAFPRKAENASLSGQWSFDSAAPPQIGGGRIVATGFEHAGDVQFSDGYGIGLGIGSGAEYHILPYLTGQQTIPGGGSLPYDYGMSIQSDTYISFVETDGPTVTGWINPNNGGSIVSATGIRVGDKAGEPQASLDVRGTINFNGNTAAGFALETRSNDPSSPADGQGWIRSDQT